MKQWEYMREESEGGKIVDISNWHGKNGWELCHYEVSSITGNMIFIFKRSKQSDLMRFLRHMVEYYYENGGVNTQLMERLDAMIEDSND